jgi:hypothetical protein
VVKMLSDTQWSELYSSSIENRKDIVWIRKEMDMHNVQIENCREGLKALQIDQGFRKGKVVFVAASVTALLTVITNAALWLLGHSGGAK